MPDTSMPTLPAASTGRHRATWWDRLAVVLLGLAGCALSYDALRQMATAVHVRHALTYLFPAVIDGFIFYGVRALLVLREGPLLARLYAWGLFIVATAASIWANSVHALDLNRPGTVSLHLGDSTVTVLSAIPPLALAGATHLHLLIKRHGGTAAEPAPTPVPRTSAVVQDGPLLVSAQAAEVPCTAPTGLPTAVPPQRQAVGPTAPTAPVATVSPSGDGTEPATGSEGGGDPDASVGQPVAAAVRAGQGPQEGSGQPPAASAGGRPAMAPITVLANVIAAAHPDGSGLTRDSARKAVTDAGLGAGTERLAEAIAQVRQGARARQHPAD